MMDEISIPKFDINVALEGPRDVIVVALRRICARLGTALGEEKVKTLKLESELQKVNATLDLELKARAKELGDWQQRAYKAERELVESNTRLTRAMVIMGGQLLYSAEAQIKLSTPSPH